MAKIFEWQNDLRLTVPGEACTISVIFMRNIFEQGTEVFMAERYDPQTIESKWQQQWAAAGLYDTVE
ncbi:MAG: hypothetical protein KDE58_00945, partial [Caldilineaceae bacterium]|nr:hypothetical protein [Caldilineaceae bacterium]